MAPRYTLVLSDVHLCDVVPDGSPWMSYRQRQFLLDDELARLLDSAAARAGRDTLEVVFNGDLLDFDAPPADARAAATLAPMAAHAEGEAVSRLCAILDDHPAVVDAIARLLVASHRVVFVPGNHDAQLGFEGVREALVARLWAATGGDHDAVERIAFRSLFHRTADGVHVEHGHQYDPLCALASPAPIGDRLEPTAGSVVATHVPEMSGCINPYAADPFASAAFVDIFGAVTGCPPPDHDTTTAWPRRVAAAASMVHQLAAMRVPDADARHLADRVAAETGCDPRVVRQHIAMFAERATAADFMTAVARGTYGPEVDRQLRDAARAIARLYGCRGVVLGHTHVAYGGWDAGNFLANSGAWAPAVDDPASGARGTFVWIVGGRDAAIQAATRHYDAGALP